MARLVFFLCAIPGALSAVIYIDRFTLDCNQKIGNWSTAFTHDERRNAIVNVTIEIFKPMSKMLVYARINLAENEHDRNYKRDFLRTVFDIKKTLKGSQNFLVSAFMANLRTFMDFEVQFPLQPVSISPSLSVMLGVSFISKKVYRIVNFNFDSKYLPPLTDIRGYIEFRGVGKFEGSKSMQHMAVLTYYGGLLK